MFLLFSLTGASTSLFDEKKAGLYQRLLAAPVRRTHILWSKYIFGILLGVVQLLTLFVAGHVLFGVDITSNVFNLLLICLAAASACVAFGMLLAALAPSAAAANGMGTLLILTMSAVGGAWWPTSFMPPFMQQLSKFTIVYWSIEGFLRVLWANCNTRELLPVLGILLAFADPTLAQIRSASGAFATGRSSSSEGERLACTRHTACGEARLMITRGSTRSRLCAMTIKATVKELPAKGAHFGGPIEECEYRPLHDDRARRE